MKCAECKHVEFVDENGSGVCKLNPPQTIGIPQHNRITGETAMTLQPANPIVTQGDYDNRGCSFHEEIVNRIDLS